MLHPVRFLPTHRVYRIFSQDVNGDGRLSLGEFLHLTELAQTIGALKTDVTSGFAAVSGQIEQDVSPQRKAALF